MLCYFELRFLYFVSSSDILEKLNQAIDNQDEGIVVKDFESYYIPSQRNAGWYKIKPDVCTLKFILYGH
jgi:ATP-dependent DNA ligase